jgi:2,4-dienoyl-CoA reductase-like NADH-dependent reductase (Old Yellow Enzyme family)
MFEALAHNVHIVPKSSRSRLMSLDTASSQADLQSAFTPLALGPIELRNRFVKAGTYEGMNVANSPSRALVQHHAELAAHGVGLTTLGYTAVHPDGRTFAEESWIDERNLDAFRALTTAVHTQSGKVALQLGHCGTMTRTPNRTARKPGGPSKTLNLYGAMVGALFTREMSHRDIGDVVGQFVAAARHAADAGFDAVELHMGHGYLLSQFLSPLANRRQDEYGGSAEKRARFSREVTEAVVDAVGHRMAVLAKLNLRDGARGGVEIEDSIVTARALQSAGLHGLVMTGGFSPFSPMYLFRGNSPVPAMLETETSRWNRFLLKLGAKTAFRDMPFEEMYFLKFARQMREAVTMPLGLLGGLRSAENIASAMSDGFDFVVLGRPLLAQPDFVARVRADATARSNCINCNRCVAEFSTPAGVRCVLNGPNDPTLNAMRAA